MSIIHFFDTNSGDSAAIQPLFGSLEPNNHIEFHAGPVAALADAEIISLFISSKVTAEMMAAMPNLRLIACRSTGYDNIDLAAAQSHKITVCNVPSYGDNTVAEYGFGLVLALTRKIPLAIEHLKAGQTSRADLRGSDLMDKTLGLVGAGRIGCRMAAIARGFGMKVVAFDAYPNPQRAEEYGFTYASLDEVLATADILSVHVPASPKTNHLLNAAAFAKMKPSAFLLNTARGEVVDTAALVEALSVGRLAGAALDVFEGENQTTPEVTALQQLPNVILTNHNAFNTIEAVGRINQVTVENIAAYLGGTPQNEIRPS